MYIALYDENRKHISNVDNTSLDLTERVYDLDTFNADGICNDDVNNSKIAVVNNDMGEYEYACLIDNITPDGRKRIIKGLDFKTLWETEILLDFTVDGSFDGRVSALFNYVKSAVFDSVDAVIGKIPIEVIIPTDNTDTTVMFGSYQGQYVITDAYKFLKCYLKYYEYMSVDNLKIVLNVEEDCEQFERRNYTYIMQSNKKEIEERIVNNLDLYIENVYLKLSQSYESEEVIANFLSNETIKEENKIGIITKTDFKFAKLKDINEKFYKQLLFEAKIEPTWENFLVAYNVIGFDESIKKFIDNINGEIYGKFSELPEDLNVKVFEDILSSEFDENVFIGLAKSIDRKFVLNEQYGKNNNIKSFILNGCFLYNKNDMRFLKNPPSTIPYLIAYQNNIKEEMKDFFGDISFKPLTVRNVIEEQMINLDFKKEYIKLYGDKFDISGIEEIVSKFLLDNECIIKEQLLYKFTNVNIKSGVKMNLLLLTIKSSKIDNLSKFKTYFCSIDEKYKDLWNKNKKIKLENTNEIRSIVGFMKKINLVNSYTTRDKIIHVNCS